MQQTQEPPFRSNRASSKSRELRNLAIRIGRTVQRWGSGEKELAEVDDEGGSGFFNGWEGWEKRKMRLWVMRDDEEEKARTDYQSHDCLRDSLRLSSEHLSRSE